MKSGSITPSEMVTLHEILNFRNTCAVKSDANKTLTVQITDLVAGRYTVEWHQVMAATLLATLPVSIMFAWLQRYLVKGLALGAVK